jgi:PAP2 superfamily
MSVAPLHRTASSPHRGSIEAATLVALYAVYEIVRGQGHATVSAARTHTDWIVELERRFHVFGERAVQHAADAVPGAPTLLGIAYIALHFVGTTAFLVWLYRRHPERFPLVRNTLIAATGIALTLYVVFPVAPPRLAALGFVDTVSHSAKVNLSSDVLGSLYNPFAAVPSLHFGYALLVGLTIAAVVRRPLVRALALSYPLVMLLVIVATGNHFFFDAAAGGLAIGAGYVIATWVGSARPAPRRRAAAGSAAATC